MGWNSCVPDYQSRYTAVDSWAKCENTGEENATQKKQNNIIFYAKKKKHMNCGWKQHLEWIIVLLKYLVCVLYISIFVASFWSLQRQLGEMEVGAQNNQAVFCTVFVIMWPALFCDHVCENNECRQSCVPASVKPVAAAVALSEGFKNLHLWQQKEPQWTEITDRIAQHYG